MASSRGYGAPPHFSTALGGARKIAAAPDFAVREPPARGYFDEPPTPRLGDIPSSQIKPRAQYIDRFTALKSVSCGCGVQNFGIFGVFNNNKTRLYRTTAAVSEQGALIRRVFYPAWNTFGFLCKAGIQSRTLIVWGIRKNITFF